MKFKIEKGKQKKPIRACIYGPAGIGKSTFAAQFPDPLFIDVEGGTHELDVARLPIPETWNELLEMIDAVVAEPDVCKTLVIDTIDRAEMLLTNQLLAEKKCDSIESYAGGYGKGYTALQERFQKDFLNRLDRVIAKGVNVTLVAHAMMRKFESPEDPPYDRWELKVSKKVAPVVKEWADLLLFANYDAMIVEDDNGKAKAKGKAKKVVYTTYKPTYDAKNRYGLPDTIPLDFKALKHIYEGSVEPKKEKTRLEIDTPVTEPVSTTVEDPRDVLLRRLAGQGISQLRFEAWCVATGRLAPGSGYMDLSGTQASSMIEHFDALTSEIKKGDANK